MKKWSRILCICMVIAILCSSLWASAAEIDQILSISAELRMTKNQLDVQNKKVAEIERKMQRNEPDAIRLYGVILSQNPLIIKSFGSELEYLVGPIRTYQISNPENGIFEAGMYAGSHLISSKEYSRELGYYYILGPCSQQYYAMDRERFEMMDTVSNLEKKIEKLNKQAFLLNGNQIIAAMKTQQRDSMQDMIFQIGNPYMVAYGTGYPIETNNYGAAPVVINGVTMIPIRPLAEGMGGAANWYEETQTITFGSEDRLVTLTLGSTTAYVNETPVQMVAPAMIINGKTMIPLRFAAENMGATVQWIPDGQYIRVSRDFMWMASQEEKVLEEKIGYHRIYDFGANISYLVPDHWNYPMNEVMLSIHPDDIGHSATVKLSDYEEGNAEEKRIFLSIMTGAGDTDSPVGSYQKYKSASYRVNLAEYGRMDLYISDCDGLSDEVLNKIDADIETLIKSIALIISAAG